MRLPVTKWNKRLRTRKIIPFILVFLLSGNIQAQEVYDLSQCVITGLEQNFSVKVARNNEEIAGNNYNRGNAGFLPTVTTTNRYGGNITSTTQNMNDGTQNVSSGIHNSTGSAAVNLGMNLFRGFNIQTTYQKLNELKQMGELNTQMSMATKLFQ